MKRLALALVILAALAAWRWHRIYQPILADFTPDEANRYSREHLHLDRVEGRP